MYWKDSFAGGNKTQQRRFSLWRNLVPVRIDHQCIVLAEVLSVDIFQIIGICKIDSLRTQCCHQGWNSFYGSVMSVVTQK